MIEHVKRHIKTHSERSDEDRAAVTILQAFLRSNGIINTNFSCDDKWPNHDGTFEYVSNPDISRRPEQNFFVQIKGTHIYTETDNCLKYCLKSLAFPAFIYCDGTLDPGVLFVVLNPDCRGDERVFWRYMSVDFINSIDYENGSTTIEFTPEEEIKNTNESIAAFCESLANIIDHHLFIKKLDNRDYSENDVKKIILACNEQITESIDKLDIFNATRDDISKRILNRLRDLCESTLLLNSINDGFDKPSIRLAWERSLLDIDTKYLGAFYKALIYIGNRVPDDGQSERLMLKYYDFLWQIRMFLSEKYDIPILCNLEKFPLNLDEIDNEYYEKVAIAIDSIELTSNILRASRFYVQKKVPFFVGTERYYEVTLQLAGIYATKYNRITVYTKSRIESDYSIQIGFTDAMIDLWGIDSKIKVVTNWKVSIEPACLNKLAKILRISIKLSSNYGEYEALMNYLTKTGINFFELINLQQATFLIQIEEIYQNTKTINFKEILLLLRNNYSKASKLRRGYYVISYLLLNLREETLECVLPNKFSSKCICDELYLSSKCFPFDKNPFISNLVGKKTSDITRIRDIVNIARLSKIDMFRPFLSLETAIKQTGEIYFDETSIASKKAIEDYNCHLDSWERGQGYKINQENGLVCIDSYEKTTIEILRKLSEFSNSGNRGQRELNMSFIKKNEEKFTDKLKKDALKNVFIDSHLLLIYGAAGTGKTTLINYISDLMAGRSKLFLTKTYTALQNLKRRISNPGPAADFVSIDSFTRTFSLPDYDIIFVDECSTIDNRTMLEFINKMNPNTFLVLAGDIYQIESIDFGNWFFYAKDIIKAHGANVELLSTWRTDDETLIELWNEVRKKNLLITEKLVIDGPFSEDIGPKVFEKAEDDEVVLCLNYDGKFGLNNINNYFQNANKNGEAVSWQEWTYKAGDPILFNDAKRFTTLYNNMKGRIVEIIILENKVTFTIDVEGILTEMDCQKDDLDFIDVIGSTTRIRLSVYHYDSSKEDEDVESMRMKSVIPFQLAYAVSIHKAQGLEYDSVKVIIPSNNSEKITHGIFYTAITRAKKKLKIYWSAETMKEIVETFSTDNTKIKSLNIVKSKLL